MLPVAVVLGLAGMVLLVIAGYILGANRSIQSSEQLVEENRQRVEDLQRARAQLVQQQEASAERMRAGLEKMLDTLVRHTDTMQKLLAPLSRHDTEVAGLRNVVQQMLTPMAQRERFASELANFSTDGHDPTSLTRLLDQIAEKGQFWAVLLSDHDGLPLAVSHNAKNVNKLTAVSSLMLLLADRIGRDGAPAPLSILIHDEANMTTLCRIFQINGQRLLLTAVSTGADLSPTALDPALAKVGSVLSRSS